MPTQIEICEAAETHLVSCDEDGYCNACGHQERTPDLQRARVVLLIDFDINTEDHPSAWDWATILDMPPDRFILEEAE